MMCVRGGVRGEGTVIRALGLGKHYMYMCDGLAGGWGWVGVRVEVLVR